MKKRPLLIVILGLLHIFEPISKIIYFKIKTGFSFSIILYNILALDHFTGIFEFWFLFPIGGIALLLVKRWSFPIFVFVQIYSIYTHLSYQKYNWPYVSEKPHITSVLLLLFNLLFIIYVFLPDIRKLFFNPRLRWWEPKPRYTIKIPCIVTLPSDNSKKPGEIINISETGAFVNAPLDYKFDDIIHINFTFYNLDYYLKARVANVHTINGVDGLGIQFKFNHIGERLYLRRLTKALNLLNV